jgi:NAD dependent epimerase/dehydratase
VVSPYNLTACFGPGCEWDAALVGMPVVISPRVNPPTGRVMAERACVVFFWFRHSVQCRSILAIDGVGADMAPAKRERPGGGSVKILVTGAEGFIGSHIVEGLCEAGHDVTAYVLYNSFGKAGWLDSPGFQAKGQLQVVAGDVRDADSIQAAMGGQDVVVHLAALIAIPYSYQAPRSYMETNVIGTMNVIEAARRVGVSRVVHTSTSEVYGTAQYVPIDEKHPLVGQSPYSASKIGADQVAHSYWSSFGVPVTTVRPFNTYGPRQSQRAFIPSVIVQMLSGVESISLGSLSPTRDLTFVTDTAEGFRVVAEGVGGLGEVFNMGSGFEISMGEVVDMLSEISGRKVAVTEDPARVRPENSEVERLWSDSSKIEGACGWKPSHEGRDGLYRGLEKTYRWFRDNSNEAGYDAKRYVV